jgi:hypothetical protein
LESGSAQGGSGWAERWSAFPLVFGTGAGHSGARYLDMTSTRTVLRSATIEPGQMLRLRFWVRFQSMDAGDGAYVRLSDDGVSWTVYSVYREDRNDGAWYRYDISVSFPTASQRLYVRFQAQTDAADDVWHVDDVEIAALAP